MYPRAQGNGTPLQHFCLANPMDRGAWWAVVHGVAKSWARLSDFPFTFHFHALEDHEKILEEVIVENFPKMGKEIVTQVQETQRVPDRINPRQNTQDTY